MPNPGSPVSHHDRIARRWRGRIAAPRPRSRGFRPRVSRCLLEGMASQRRARLGFRNAGADGAHARLEPPLGGTVRLMWQHCRANRAHDKPDTSRSRPRQGSSHGVASRSPSGSGTAPTAARKTPPSKEKWRDAAMMDTKATVMPKSLNVLVTPTNTVVVKENAEVTKGKHILPRKTPYLNREKTHS